MTAEGELLRRLRAALGAAGLDEEVDRLIEESWNDARQEVREALRRLMVHDLLERARARLAYRTVETEPPIDAPDTDAPGPAASSTAPDVTYATEGEADLAGRSENATVAPDPGSAAATATYLFAIGDPDLRLPDGVPYLPRGGPLEVVDAAGLRAVICQVDPSVFDAMHDLDGGGLELLADAARAHDTVLATLAERATILPLSLGTVVPDRSTVTELLTGEAAALRTELDRVAGYREWAVTVRLLSEDGPDGEEERTVGEADRPEELAPSGRAYLEERQAALSRRQARWRERDRLASEAHERLAAGAADAQRIQRRPLEEGPPPELHGVYLVAEAERDAFEQAVADVAAGAPDALVDLSGPFPPYHFTTVALGHRR
jgi:hypothetical protein